jgi:hypothetical protein
MGMKLSLEEARQRAIQLKTNNNCLCRRLSPLMLN